MSHSFIFNGRYYVVDLEIIYNGMYGCTVDGEFTYMSLEEYEERKLMGSDHKLTPPVHKPIHVAPTLKKRSCGIM